TTTPALTGRKRAPVTSSHAEPILLDVDTIDLTSEGDEDASLSRVTSEPPRGSGSSGKARYGSTLDTRDSSARFRSTAARMGGLTPRPMEDDIPEEDYGSPGNEAEWL